MVAVYLLLVDMWLSVVSCSFAQVASHHIIVCFLLYRIVSYSSCFINIRPFQSSVCTCHCQQNLESTVLYFHLLPLWATFVISLACGAITALLVLLLVVPWQRKKIKGGREVRERERGERGGGKRREVREGEGS